MREQRRLLTPPLCLLLIVATWGSASAQVPPGPPACRDVAGSIVCETVDTAVAAAGAQLASAKAAVEQAPKDVQQAVQPHLDAALAALGAARAELEAKARPTLREALLLPPEKVWTSLNMGPGSGLDADTLDSYHAEHFLDTIAAEAATRAAEDAVLRTELAAEAAARAAEDAALQGRVDNIEAVFDDALAAEADLRAKGDEALRTELNIETATREAAEAALRTDLRTEINDRRDAVLAEETARKDADNGLTARIGRVEASIPETAWATVLARDGAGSGLDADTLDGLPSSAFAPSAHDHDVRYYTKGQSDARFLRVGGKAADADRLDGLDSGEFARAAHDHDARYYSRTEVDALLGAVAGVPAGAVLFFNRPACPPGWGGFAEAQGRYLVGMGLGGSLGATAGTALADLEDRPVGRHTHDVGDPGHNHEYTGAFVVGQADNDPRDIVTSDAGAMRTSTERTGITLSPAGAVAGTNAPYVQLLACEKL